MPEVQRQLYPVLNEGRSLPPLNQVDIVDIVARVTRCLEAEKVLVGYLAGNESASSDIEGESNADFVASPSEGRFVVYMSSAFRERVNTSVNEALREDEIYRAVDDVIEAAIQKLSEKGVEVEVALDTKLRVAKYVLGIVRVDGSYIKQSYHPHDDASEYELNVKSSIERMLVDGLIYNDSAKVDSKAEDFFGKPIFELILDKVL